MAQLRPIYLVDKIVHELYKVIRDLRTWKPAEINYSSGLQSTLQMQGSMWALSIIISLYLLTSWLFHTN